MHEAMLRLLGMALGVSKRRWMRLCGRRSRLGSAAFSAAQRHLAIAMREESFENAYRPVFDTEKNASSVEGARA